MEQGDQLPAKRQRLSFTSRASRTLSTKQLDALHAAQRIEYNSAIDGVLHGLGRGKAAQGEIAWSKHNLLAYASTSSPDSSITDSHVVLRHASAQAPTPCRLYPPPLHSDAPQTATSSNSLLSSHVGSQKYDDPTSIAFSPCGFYLSAFFPPHNRRRIAMPQTSTAADQILVKDLFQVTEPIEGSSNGALPMIGQLSAGLTAHIGARQQAAEVAAGKLCIWSRADSGALNDWSIVYSVSVSEENGSSSGRSLNSDNLLKVDENGQQIAEHATGLTQSKDLLRGGVLQTLWLNQRRRTVFSTSSTGAKEFDRLPARGPKFLPSAPCAMGPDADLALLIFGRQGQVSLLHSRHCDKVSQSTPLNTISPLFSVLQSALHVPCILPAPATFDSEGGDKDSEAYEGVHASSSAFEDADISHLSVGMLANSATLLVAYKRQPYANAVVDLTEISIDLTSEAVSMITRPVQSLSLAATCNVGAPKEEEETVSVEGGVSDQLIGMQHFNSLDWAEVEEDSTKLIDAGKVGSLRLLATFSRCRTSVGVTKPGAEEQALELDSLIKVWDIYKAERELSDAFAVLDCRKTGHASKHPDWKARLTAEVPVRGKAVTSLLTRSSTIPLKNIVAVTMLVPSQELARPVVEQICHFDLKRAAVLMSTAQKDLPPQALSRTSELVFSPNGVLAAAISSSVVKARSRKLVLWKHHVSAEIGQHESSSDHVSSALLYAHACVTGTDAADVVRHDGNAGVTTGGYSEVLIDTAGLLRMSDRSKTSNFKLEAGQALPTDRAETHIVDYRQAARLLQLRVTMSVATNAPSPEMELFFLELALCLQLLRLARIDVAKVSADSKADEKTGLDSPPAAATLKKACYNPEGVWQLLTHLRWLLEILDRVARVRMLNDTQEDRLSFERHLVNMLDTMTIPRQLLLEVLARFCDFKDWLLSTSSKRNLPPAKSHHDAETGQTWAAVNGIDASAGVTATSEQMELARDVCRHILVSASVGLDDFARVLSDYDETQTDHMTQETTRPWWSRLSATKEHITSDTGVKTSLLDFVNDPETGAVHDVLTLFLSPSDLLDEKSVLYDTNKTALSDGFRQSPVKDIVRKAPLKNAMSQSTIYSMALTNPSAYEAGVVVMRKKQCLNCHFFSQDAVLVSTTMRANSPLANTAAVLDRRHSVDIKPIGMSETISRPSVIEKQFRYACLCGGSWWVVQ